MTPPSAPLRVVIVDDSAYNRQTIASMLERLSGVEVVGRAMNGKEALRLVFDLEPDLVTLDLEMPEMDGFAFLRLVMGKRPTPVIVVSGYAQRENVFRALELGALDFVAKPSREVSPELRHIESELLQKIELVRRLQAIRLVARAQSFARQAVEPVKDVVARAASAGSRATRVLAIGASTGGPPAISQVLAALPFDPTLGVAIAQHMPARFTRAFAERLDRVTAYRVVEAADGDVLRGGCVYVAPGGQNLTAESSPDGVRLRVGAAARNPATPSPSADRLFATLAPLYQARLSAIVLTGMGSDGREGARAVREAGGFIVAEDPATAVMPGMPASVVEQRLADVVVAVEGVAAAVAGHLGVPSGGGDAARGT